MHTTNGRNGTGPSARRAKTVEELLEQERARSRSALRRSLGALADELTVALEESPLGRHPILAGGAAAVLGLVSGPLLVRGLAPSVRALLRAAGPLLALLSPAVGLGLRWRRFL